MTIAGCGRCPIASLFHEELDNGWAGWMAEQLYDDRARLNHDRGGVVCEVGLGELSILQGYTVVCPRPSNSQGIM
jgi:hypothetical protein